MVCGTPAFVRHRMKSGLPFSRRSFLFGAIAGSSCFGAPPPLPTYADATAHSGVSFKNNASLTSQKYLLESMCGGVAMLDYDGDGWLDLIVARYLEWDFATNMWCGAHKPGYRSYCHPDQFKPVAHLAF